MKHVLLAVLCLSVVFSFTAASAADELKTFQPAKGDFSITYPADDWLMDMESGMTLSARGAVAFIDILTVPVPALREKADFSESTGQVSLEAFAEFFCKKEIVRRSMIKEYGAELLEQGAAMIGGYNAYFFMYTTRADKDPKTMLRVKEYALLTEEKGYILKFYASPGQFYAYLPVAEDIIRTFKPVATIIQPGASLEKGLDQEVRFLVIEETRETPQGLWIAGKGYGRINSESAYFHWQSATPPRIEVELLTDALSLEHCKVTLREKIPVGKTLVLKGQGDFQSKEIKNVPVGVFQLQKLATCEIISEK